MITLKNNPVEIIKVAANSASSYELTEQPADKYHISVVVDLNQNLYDPYKPKSEAFENGATLVTAPRPNSDTTAVVVSIKSGSLQEERPGSGVAHLLEHCLINNSDPIIGNMAFKDWFKEKGIAINGYTGSDFTAYELRGPVQQMQEALKVFQVMIFQPKFTRDINIEKSIIADERRQRPTNLSSPVIKLVGALGKGAPILYPTIGLPKEFKKVGYEDLKKYHRDHYISTNATITAVGNIDTHIESTLKTLASNIPNTSPFKSTTVNRPSTLRSKDCFTLEYTPHKHSYYCEYLAVPETPYTSSAYSAIIFHRLNDRIRELSGVSYGINFNYCYSSSSLNILKLEFSHTNNNYKKVKQALSKAIQELIDRPPSDGELQIAKDDACNGMRVMNADPMATANFLDYQFRQGNQITGTVSDEILKIANISLAEAHQKIKEILQSPYRIVEESKGSNMLFIARYIPFTRVVGTLLGQVESYFRRLFKLY